MLEIRIQFNIKHSSASLSPLLILHEHLNPCSGLHRGVRPILVSFNPAVLNPASPQHPRHGLTS